MVSDMTCRLATPDDDFRAFQDVQQAAWGDTELQTIPSHMFIAAANLGNVHGAFGPDGNMFGFSYSMRRGEIAYLHMIGVYPDHQNEGIAANLIRENQTYWESEGVSTLTLTFDPLEGANANLYLKDEYDHPGWIRGFYPDYYPGEEDAHRFRVEYPFDSSRPERLREQYTDPEATLLAISDEGTVASGRSLATYDSSSGRWEVPSDLPGSVAVEFPWNASELSERRQVSDDTGSDVESQWLDAIKDVFGRLVSGTEDARDGDRRYTVVDMDPYEGSAPYDGENWGAANRYVLVEQT